ncbi:MAG: Holliday junction branch migration protein RuvA [Oscillospiraceae bacterium]|nr:Holliday junction branch migration protein RuvA [Oscillospiraceae bacterium]
MFYYLNGTVAEIDINFAVVDCNGVGYGVNTTANTLSKLKKGEKAKLYICESIREDAFELYGFSTVQEKRCFEMLLTVSGIGPKAAQSILSASTPEGLALAIMNGNEKVITAAQGVGKKIAQRVILELKDKISKEAGSTAAGMPEMLTPADNGTRSDAIAALMVLGYSAPEINSVLRGVDVTGLSTEQIVKLVLKNMM